MKITETYNEKIFEDIKHIDDEGNEYWLGRELIAALEYKRWDKFSNVINSVKIACTKINNIVENHFSQVGKMVEALKKKKFYFLLIASLYHKTSSFLASFNIIKLLNIR